jgi:hypothetical protein
MSRRKARRSEVRCQQNAEITNFPYCTKAKRRLALLHAKEVVRISCEADRPSLRHARTTNTRPDSFHAAWEVELTSPAFTLRNDLAAEVRKRALWIRRRSFQMVYEAQQGHPGGDFSAADILATLYFGVMRYDAKAPNDPGPFRDE